MRAVTERQGRAGRTEKYLASVKGRTDLAPCARSVRPDLS